MSGSDVRLALAVATSVGLALGAGHARADGPAAGAAGAPGQRPLAEALFREGKKLFKEGKIAEACRKLEESEKLDPAAGTLLNLATCHEKEGRTATAWAEYKSSVEMARKANRPDRAKLAEKGIAALETKLSRLTLTVGGGAPAGLVVKLDGAEMGAGALDVAMPIDPGQHTVQATAPDMLPFEATIDVEPGASSRTFAIPPLVPAPKPDPETVVEVVPATGRWRMPVGIGVGAAGLVALGVGIGFGAKALSLGGEAKDKCANNVCTAEGYAAWQDGRAAATTADVMLVVGGVATAAGLVLIVTAPRKPAAPPTQEAPPPEPAPAAAVVPVFGRGLGAIAVQGTF
jgi:hypothetical protein